MRHFSRRRHPEKLKPFKWVVVYGGMSVECSEEAGAKKLAAKLRRKGYRLAARTADGVSPSWRIDPEELDEWLSRETKPVDGGLWRKYLQRRRFKGIG